MFQIAKEHRHFGKQILLLAKNELIKTYKGAVIGPFWAVIKPAFTLFVYWFAFTCGIKNLGDGVSVTMSGIQIGNFDRFTFMLVGFIPWFFITDSITLGAKSIRLNRQFVTKVSFPVSTIMTYTAVARLYIHLFLSALMYVYLVFISGISPSVYNVQFFFYCPLMFLFFVVLTWSTAPMSAFSRDFENMIVSIMSGIFWLSGVIYSSYNFDDNRVLKWLMMLNPINFFANGYRNAFLYHRWFFEYPLEIIVFFIEFAVIIALGIFNYNRLRKTLPDVL
ncbi:MAG: ABC transporter permease [Oscillospiraceae bacterium]|nr:ABC transporter permease [Candidatus Ruminococcus equi]